MNLENIDPDPEEISTDDNSAEIPMKVNGLPGGPEFILTNEIARARDPNIADDPERTGSFTKGVDSKDGTTPPVG